MLCEKAGSTKNGKIRKQSQNLDLIKKKKNFILIFIIPYIYIVLFWVLKALYIMMGNLLNSSIY